MIGRSDDRKTVLLYSPGCAAVIVYGTHAGWDLFAPESNGAMLTATWFKY
jgi:hypothetical protein